jgi:hypothetical protein
VESGEEKKRGAGGKREVKRRRNKPGWATKQMIEPLWAH